MTKTPWLERVFAKILSSLGLPPDGATALDLSLRDGPLASLGPTPAPDPEVGAAYTIFTTEYDRVCPYNSLLPTAEPATAPGELPLMAMENDVAVTVLIDHSGSMRRELPLVAATIEGTLHYLGNTTSSVEVLGFATGGWKGGRSRESWASKGRPPYPGRLNETLHIIYRAHGDSEVTDVASKVAAVLATPDVAKENIDGEALMWAAARLVARPETRKILILVSDGAPHDDSTLFQNGQRFLANHFRLVIDGIDRQGRIQTVGIGIKHKIEELGDRALLVTSEASLQEMLITFLNGALTERSLSP